MKPMLEIARFTILEVIRMRIFHLLLAGSLLLPLVAQVFSNLFMFDIAKVQVDVLVAGGQLVAAVYVLFVAVSLLGRDISDRVCYAVLIPPMSRQAWLLGRFIGLLAGLFLLMLAVMVIAEAVVLYNLSFEFPVYLEHLHWSAGFSLAGLTFYQYIALLAAALFVCSWATGIAEMTVFTLSVILFAWMFPPILAAMQSSDVASQVPELVRAMLRGIAWVLPEMDGGQLGLAIAYGMPVPVGSVLAHIGEHLGYALAMVGLALYLFGRRDL